MFREDRRNTLLVNSVILGTTLVLLFMLCELAARFVFRDITTAGDGTSYFVRRWREQHVRLNSWGFREQEFKMNKARDIYRIAVIGDSFTYGSGIPEENRFTGLIENFLNGLTEVKNYEVLNFGRPGAQTIDEVVSLRNIVLGTNPDFILLQWFINDVEGHNVPSGEKVSTILLSPHRTLKSSSALYSLIAIAGQSLQGALGFSMDYVGHMYQRFSDPDSPDSRKFVQALRDFIELCKNQGEPVGIVLFPATGFDLGNTYPYDYLHRRVIDVCIQEGITCVDLRSTFAPYADGRELWVNRFDAHPNSLAHRLAVEQLRETFGQLWLSGVSDW
jgi:hypothetical protein